MFFLSSVPYLVDGFDYKVGHKYNEFQRHAGQPIQTCIRPPFYGTRFSQPGK